MREEITRAEFERVIGKKKRLYTETKHRSGMAEFSRPSYGRGMTYSPKTVFVDFADSYCVCLIDSLGTDLLRVYRDTDPAPPDPAESLDELVRSLRRSRGAGRTR
jgi:hypothetical protein